MDKTASKQPDSYCITQWQKPEMEVLTWKKLSLEESLNNLKEIGGYLTSADLWQKFYLELNSKLKNSDFGQKIAEQKNDIDPNSKDEYYKNILKFWQKSSLDLWVAVATDFWEKEIKAWLAENSKSLGDYLWPLRVCLSGQKQSPSPFELLACLDRDELDYRIKTCLADV